MMQVALQSPGLATLAGSGTVVTRRNAQSEALSAMDGSALLQRLQGTTALQFGSASAVVPPEQNIIFELKKRAETAPHEVAIQQGRGFFNDITSPGVLTNQLLYENTLKVARVLKEKYGIQPGDRVATIETNTPEFFMTLFATMALGATIVPINILPLADRVGANQKLAHMLKTSNAKAVFIGKTVARDPDLSALMRLRRLQTLLVPHRKAYMRHVANGLDLTSRLFPGYFKATRTAKAAIQNLALMLNNLPAGMKIVTPQDTAHFSKMVSGQPLDEKDVVLTPNPDHEAMILFTSGTTSMPKGVPISHGNLAHNVNAVKTFCPEITTEDRQLVILPQFHIFGLVTFLSTLSAGVTNILIPSPTDGARNPRELMNTIQREKVTLMPAIPKIIERLLKQEGAADKLQSLRILMSGGEKLPMDLYNQTKKLLPNTKLWQGYGSTEVKILTINKDEQNDGALHVGRSISPDIQIDLRTPNDQGIGEIWVQTPGNSQRYLGVSADEAGNTFQPNGWVNMGDLGAQDERTNLKVMGRSKEIIKRAGEILSPDDFDLRLNQVLVQDGAKVIKDAITFSYTPPGTDRESVVSIVLLADGFKQETGQSLNARLQQVVKAGTMTGRYVPDLILPLTQKNFPEGFLSAIGKKQYKNCRAFLNDLIAKGAIKLNGKDVQILKPEQLGG